MNNNQKNIKLNGINISNDSSLIFILGPCQLESLSHSIMIIETILNICEKKPFSLEVFSDDYSGMKQQAVKINSWAKNVYVKIPVINSKGNFMGKIIKELNNKKIKIDNSVKKLLKKEDDLSGTERFTDIGDDPEEVRKENELENI